MDKTISELFELIKKQGRTANLDIPVINMDGREWNIRLDRFSEPHFGDNQGNWLKLEKLYEIVDKNPQFKEYLKLRLEELILVDI